MATEVAANKLDPTTGRNSMLHYVQNIVNSNTYQTITLIVLVVLTMNTLLGILEDNKKATAALGHVPDNRPLWKRLLTGLGWGSFFLLALVAEVCKNAIIASVWPVSLVVMLVRITRA
jgi:hypothetical protein